MKIGIVFPSKKVENKGIKRIGQHFSDMGHEVLTFYFNDEKMLELLELQMGISFMVAHGNVGISESLADHYNKNKITFISLIDTPYNKVDGFRIKVERRIFINADKTFNELTKRIAGTDTVFFQEAFGVIPLEKKNINIIEFKEREIDLLFLGRLGFEKLNFSKFSLIQRIFAKRLIRKAFFPEEKQMHEIVISFFSKFSKIGFFKDGFYSKSFMDYIWRLAHGVRSQRRLFVLDELIDLSALISKTFVTDTTEYIDNKNVENSTIIDFQPWDIVVDLMNTSKIVINIQPFHIHGSHERLLTAMALGCLVVTDRNSFLESKFVEDEDIIFFDYSKGDLKNRIEMIFSDVEKMKRIALSGQQKVLKNDMAINRAENLLTLLDEVPNN